MRIGSRSLVFRWLKGYAIDIQIVVDVIGRKYPKSICLDCRGMDGIERGRTLLVLILRGFQRDLLFLLGDRNDIE